MTNYIKQKNVCQHFF